MAAPKKPVPRGILFKLECRVYLEYEELGDLPEILEGLRSRGSAKIISAEPSTEAAVVER